MLEYIEQVARKYHLLIGNMFHAGDGNLHPLIMFDARDADQARRARQAAEEILARCVEMGGALTGEHGIGLEKRDLMPLAFSADDLEMMRRLKSVFDPQGRFNPGKLLPAGQGHSGAGTQAGTGETL
jgi:glycolate oxidase